MKMSATWEDDAFGGSSDPFGVSGDVFGRELGEVDPFGGHDSFDVDAEWDHFDEANFHPEKEEGEKSSSRRKTSSRTSTRTAPDSPRKKKGKKPISSKAAPSSRKLMTVAAPKSPTHSIDDTKDDQRRGRSSSRGSGTEASTGSRSHSQGRRSRSRSSSAGPGGREASTTNGKYRGTKAERKQQLQQQQPSHGILKPSTPTQPSGFEATFGDDPFGSNHVDDGFGDFVAFPVSHNNNNNNNHNNHDHDDGFGAFGDFEETSRSAENSPSNRHKRPIRVRAKTDSAVSRHASFEDDLAPKMPSFRRNSVGHSNPVGLGGSIHSNASSAGNSTTRFRHSRNRNGVMTRTRPSEQISKIQESKERRNAIKDSLLGALGGDSSHEEVTLDNFLGGSRKTAQRRGSDAVSIHSAPAAIRAPPRSTRRLSSHDDHHSAGSGGVSLTKSKRYQRRMGSASSGSVKETISTTTREPFKLDIAELAKQGYLEVQDGKMRLVIDVEPS